MTELAPVVHVVDDDELKAHRSRLLHVAGYTRGYGSPVEFLPADRTDARMRPARRPDGELHGLEVQQALTPFERRRPIVFLTGDGDIPTSVRGDQGRSCRLPHQAGQPEVLIGAAAAPLRAMRRRGRPGRSCACCAPATSRSRRASGKS